jgi:hypothetical protein
MGPLAALLALYLEETDGKWETLERELLALNHNHLICIIIDESVLI